MSGIQHPEVTALFARATRFRAETDALRALCLETDLTETFKWKQACYTLNGGNVCIVHRMKDCAALAFFKGALMADPAAVMVAPGPNSRASRQLRFASLEEITAATPLIRAYLSEAITLEKSGAKVDFQAAPTAPMPEEMTRAFEADPELFDAYDALTPGRKRSWIIHVTGAKQSATRTSRITKAKPLILRGKGLNGR
ncbi:MAG: YdeI/OmpD-associated family protein [Maritimibacter sp.]